MAAILVKGIPEELQARLRELAVRHRRSLTKEIIVLLERAVVEEGDRPSLPAPIVPKRPFGTKEILRARREGRA